MADLFLGVRLCRETSGMKSPACFLGTLESSYGRSVRRLVSEKTRIIGSLAPLPPLHVFLRHPQEQRTQGKFFKILTLKPT